MHYLSEENIGLFLLQFALLLGCARLVSHFLSRFKWPAITGEIFVGILFGPTVLGRFFPGLFSRLFPSDLIQQNMLETTAWLGLLFLLLETGLELDLATAIRRGKQALVIAFSDLLIPFLIAGVFGTLLVRVYSINNEVIFVLFFATTMTISAMPVAIRIMRDLYLFKTELGTLILSALSINDLVGWLVFTVVLGLFTEHGKGLFDAVRIFLVVVGLTWFSLSIGKKAIERVLSFWEESGGLSPGHALTTVAVLGAIMGALTQWIGIHALFGFFLAGVMVSSSKVVSEFVRSVIAQMVHALLVPLFFVSIGLKLDFVQEFDWFLVLSFSIIGIGGRFLGAVWGARLAGVRRDEMVIALPHIPGGAMEIVLALLALEYGLINAQIFVAIVISAVLSSVIAGPVLARIIFAKIERFKVSKMISAQRIFFLYDLHTKWEALERMVSELVKAGEVTKDQAEEVLYSVKRREEEVSTGLGKGVAVPHARIGGLKEPIVSLAILVPPVPWDSPDGREVDIVFLTVTPKEDFDEQLKIVSQIACLVENYGLSERLRKCKSKSEVMDVLKETFVSAVLARRSE